MILPVWSCDFQGDHINRMGGSQFVGNRSSNNGGAGFNFANVIEHKALQIFVAAFLMSKMEMK